MKAPDSRGFVYAFFNRLGVYFRFSLLNKLIKQAIIPFLNDIPTDSSLLAYSRTGGLLFTCYHYFTKPILWLSALFIYIIFIPYSFLPRIKGIPLFQMIPMAIISVFYYLSPREKHFKLNKELKPAIKTLILWILLNMLSSGQTPPLQRSYMNLFYFIWSGSLLFFAVYHSHFSHKQILFIIKVFAACVFMEILYSLFIHYFGEISIFQSAWRTTLKQSPQMLKVYNHFTPSSAFGNSSMRGALFISIIPFLTFSAFKKSRKRVPYLFLLVIAIWSLVLCDTKGPWISLLLIFSLFLGISHWEKIKSYFLSSGKLIILPVFLLIAGILTYLIITDDFDARHRVIQIKVSWNILRTHFLWGVGTKNYSVFADEYKFLYKPLISNLTFSYNVADNFWLTWIVEKGIIISLISFYFLGKLIRLIIQIIKTGSLQYLSIPLCFCLTFLFESLFWDNGHHLTFRVIFIVMASLIIRESEAINGFPRKSRQKRF